MTLLRKFVDKKIYFIIIIIPFIILLLDLINVSRIIPFTFRFDWLAFIGGYLSFFATLILARVSIKQNDKLNEINNKIIINNAIVNCYSKITLGKNHYFQTKNEYLSKDYGNILKNINYKMSANSNNYFRFIFEIKDDAGRPLKSAKINNIIFQLNPIKENGNYNWGSEFNYENIDCFDVVLEKNANNDDIYYLPTIIVDQQENIENLLKSEEIRITINFSIKNIFKVINISEHTILLLKTNQKTNLGEKYKEINKKAYYIDAFL